MSCCTWISWPACTNAILILICCGILPNLFLFRSQPAAASGQSPISRMLSAPVPIRSPSIPMPFTIPLSLQQPRICSDHNASWYQWRPKKRIPAGKHILTAAVNTVVLTLSIGSNKLSTWVPVKSSSHQSTATAHIRVMMASSLQKQ